MPHQSILETLYLFYSENQTSDDDAIKEGFQKLNDCTAYLSFSENDNLCNIVCQLCTEHERRAYCAGFQTAFRLIEELRCRNDYP